MRSEAATDKVPEVLAVHEAPQSSPGYVCGRGKNWEEAVSELWIGGRRAATEESVQAPEVSASKRAQSCQTRAPILGFVLAARQCLEREETLREGGGWKSSSVAATVQDFDVA